MYNWSTLKKLIWLYAAKLKGGAQAIIETITGTLPLVLQNALSHAILSLTRYGLCTQPAAPMYSTITQDGKCEQRNLPSGYTELTYLQSDGTQLMPIDFTRQSGKAYQMAVDLETSVFPSNLSNGLFTLGADYGGYCCVSFKINNNNMVVMSGGMASSGVVYSGRATYTVSVATDGKTCTLTDGTNTGTFTRASANYSGKPVLFGLGATYKGSSKIYSAKIWEDGVLKYSFVPCKRNSDDVFGMYDLVNGAFLAPSTGTLIAGDVVTPTPTAPMDIWCNNGKLKWDSTNQQVISDGTPEVLSFGVQNRSVPNLLSVGDYKDTYELISGLDTHNVGIKVFDGTEAFEELEGAAIIQGATAAWGTVARAVGLCTHLVSLAESDTASAGTYRFATALNFYQYKTTFGVSNITGLKALLAELFAAGNPIIMLFPLATATTETVTVDPIDRTYPQEITTTAEVTNITVTETHADVSTPSPQTPLPVWCNNGKLTKSANIVDVNGQSPVNLAYVANKLVTNAIRYGYYVPVKPNTKYTISINREKTNAYLNICETTSVPANNVSVGAYSTMDGTTSSKTITTKTNTNYLYVYTAAGYAPDRDPFTRCDFQIEKGETASPYHPFVYADGTPEVLTVSGINLYDPSTRVDGYRLKNTGTVADSGWCYSAPIPVEYGKTYTLSGVCSETGNKFLWYYSDSDEPSSANYVGQTYKNVSTAGAYQKSITINNANVKFVRISIPTSDEQVVFNEGNSAADYQPYVPPQTASVPMLLGVGDYKDEAEIISGIKTGKVAVAVLDGTETDWAKLVSAARVMFYRDSNLPEAKNVSTEIGAIECTIATHGGNSWVSTADIIVQRSSKNFGFMNPTGFTTDSTVDEWKAYLAAQYTAGTPIIIIYPLATETTEHTTAQHLVTNEGTNIVDSVANVGPVEAKVEYMAASAQDVLSKLLGMKVTKKDISTQDAENMIDIITGEENK